MSANILLNEILAMLHQVKDSEEDLEKIHNFLLENIMEDEDEPEVTIPEKYKELVSDIVDNLESGFSTKIDAEKAVIISAVNEYGFTVDLSEEDEYKDENDTDEDEETENFGSFINIERLESFESFEIMENFANSLDASPLKKQLLNALLQKKPFANFNAIIHNSPDKTNWFNFKRKALEQHVVGILTANSLW